MNLTPRPYARYRNDVTGESWDTRHYDDDAPAFPAFDGGTWRRTALTEREYTTAEAAQAPRRVRLMRAAQAMPTLRAALVERAEGGR